VNFLDLDTIGVVVDMEPCADPMNFDVDVCARRLEWRTSRIPFF
jgi:hypothetical protein